MYTKSKKNYVLSLSMLLLALGSLHAADDNNSKSNSNSNGNGNGSVANAAANVLGDAATNIGELINLFGGGIGQLFGAVGAAGETLGDVASDVADSSGVKGAAGAVGSRIGAVLNSDAVRWLGSKAAQGAGAAIDFAAKQAKKFELEKLAEIGELQEQLERGYDRHWRPLTAGARKHIEERIAELKQEARRNRERVQDLVDKGTNFIADMPKQAMEMGKQYIAQEQIGKQNLQQAAVKAEADKEAAIAKTQAVIAAVTDKQNIKKFVIAGSALVLSYYTIKYGSALAHDAIKHYYRNPTLSTDTTLVSPLQAFKQNIVSRMTGQVAKKPSVKDVILESELAKRVEILDKSIQNTVRNGAPFGIL
jgi:hypothetical protein